MRILESKKKRTQNKTVILVLVLILFVNLSNVFYNSSIFPLNIYEDIESIIENFPDDQNTFEYEREISLEFKVLTEDLKISEIMVETGEMCTRLSFKGESLLYRSGSPCIPMKTLKILLPKDYCLESVEIGINKIEFFDLDYRLEPAQEFLPIGLNVTSEYVFNSNIYQSSDLFPGNYYSIEGVYGVRGYQILVLNIFPIQYIPNNQKISFTKDMDVVVNLLKQTNKKADEFLRNLVVDREKVMSMVENPDEISTYNTKETSLKLSAESYDYVIITNEALKNSGATYTFQDLADYKTSNGITTTIVTVEEIYANYTGVDDQEKIRNFIIDAYNNWGIEYVLLGGDGDGADVGGESEPAIIPARGFYSSDGYGDDNIPSDLYYAALDGSWNSDGDEYWGEDGEEDLYAEVYIGRAPVDSVEEVSNFVMKTLSHEMNTDESYLSSALFLGEDLGWSVWAADYKDEVLYGSSNNNYTTDGIPEEFNVTTLYDRDIDPYRWDSTDLVPLLNDGVHVINHLGHANNYNVMNIDNDIADHDLTNEDYFFLYSQGCYAGAFDNRGSDYDGKVYFDYDCVAEHLITSPNGAFAVIANSRYGWGNRYSTNGPSQFFDREFFDAVFGEGIVEIGKANQDSKEDCIGFLSQSLVKWCYYETNLLGDPTANILPRPNNEAPILSDEFVTPKTGNQDTPITFTVSYSDADNNRPLKICIVINDTEYYLEKQDPFDEDYTDGCDYQVTIYLQSASTNYSYFFKCRDTKFSASTIEQEDLRISYTNAEAPILSNGEVSPCSGFANLTAFQYTVIYTDSDNNAPINVSLSIDNNSAVEMIKQDPADTNYMDGCVYSFSTMIKNDGVHTYNFSCQDAEFINSTILKFGPNVCELLVPFDGMEIYYNFSMYGFPYITRLQYSRESISTFIIYWQRYYSYTMNWVPWSRWRVDVSTRIMEEISHSYFGNAHTPIWIYPNATVGDIISMAVINEGDYNFSVSRIIVSDIPKYGPIRILELKDMGPNGGIAWYEQSTGILLNGTFSYNGGASQYTLDLININTNFNVTDNIEPISNFEAVNSEVITGSPVQFIFTGRVGNGPAIYEWDFGDGNVSIGTNEQNPVHYYSAEGMYDVSLKITDTDGEMHQEIKVNYINVSIDINPIADFYTNTTVICVGESIEFLFNGTAGNAPNTYMWQVKPNYWYYTYEQNYTTQYDTPGVYNITLTVRDNDLDSDTITRVRYITVLENIEPVADFYANTTTIYAGENVKFTFNGTAGNAPNTYIWSIKPDEIVESTEQIFIARYDTLGLFNVSLTVRDANGDASDMVKIDYIKVIERDIEPVADFYASITTIQAGDVVNFVFNGTEGNTPMLYAWDFGDGGPRLTVGLPTISHIYFLNGTYTVTLNITDTDGDWDVEVKYLYITVLEKNIEPFADFYTNTSIPGFNLTFMVSIRLILGLILIIKRRIHTSDFQ